MSERPILVSSLMLLAVAMLCSTTMADNPPEGSEDICRFFPNNTKIRDPESCNQYITCIDFASHYTVCSGSTPFYDKATEKCVKALTDESTCQISCEEATDRFVSDPKSCKGYFYCMDEEFALPGKCPDTTHFNETQQACVFSHESECHTDQFEFCAVVKDGVNFRDESSCDMYYSCKKGVLTRTKCKDMYYNPTTGKCVSKSTVDCAAHPLPSNVCIASGKPKKNVFVADDASCRGYFYCADKEDGTDDKNPFWYQCPPDTFFNAKIQTCVDPLTIACKWDRCDGRTKTFVLSGKKGCRHYLRCRDGITVEELSCGNLFFDEKAGICTTDVVLLDVCKS